MWQRIQSVFLLLAAAAMLVASITTLAVFMHTVDRVVFDAMGAYLDGQFNHPTWGLFAIGIVSSALAICTLFFYKKRKLQIRLSYLNIILMAGFYLYAGFVVYQFVAVEGFHFQQVGVGAIMPVIAIILTFLAIRRIAADEALVRSLHRLR